MFSTEFYSYLDDGRLIKKGTSPSPLNGAFEGAYYLTCSTNWQPYNVVFFLRIALSKLGGKRWQPRGSNRFCTKLIHIGFQTFFLIFITFYAMQKTEQKTFAEKFTSALRQ